MSTLNRRVVVTGLGLVTSIGVGRLAFTNALRAGKCGASPVTRFDITDLDRYIGCEIRGFNAEEEVLAHATSRAGAFSLAAAIEAVASAGLELLAESQTRTLVAIGTTDGCAREFEQDIELELAGKSVLSSYGHGAADISGGIAGALGLTNVETLTIGTACAAGNYAITYGYDALILGDAEVAIVGGADSMSRKTFLGFNRLGSLTLEVCRPFDAMRDGILTGEGAGVLVLETLEHARNRCAPILAEVRSGALTCDATHAVVPNREALRRCMEAALDRSGLARNDISYISAHGTGTRLNDSTETAAIHDVYETSPPPTIGLKSLLGHSMGAASAISACAAVISILENFVPPTINYANPDPECDIDCVPNVSRQMSVTAVQNNAAGFGGNNCVTIFSSYHAERLSS